MPHPRHARTPLSLALLVPLLLIPACADPIEPEAAGATTGAPAMRRETVRSADGLEFDALVETPDPARRNGWGVLMIGGGFGNDLDWTVPGSITVEGRPSQMTISGETHADAPPISAVLVGRGFTVMRWSTIARGDPLADEWPVRATTRTLPETLAHARDALRTLRETGLVEQDRIILLGHSLGAARACTIAGEDEGVRALILLAPAYFMRGAGSLGANGMRHGEEVLRARPIPCLALFGELDASKAVNASAAAALAAAAGFERLEVRLLPGLGHQLGPALESRHGPIDAGVVNELGRWAEQVAGRG